MHFPDFMGGFIFLSVGVFLVIKVWGCGQKTG